MEVQNLMMNAQWYRVGGERWEKGDDYVTIREVEDKMRVSVPLRSGGQYVVDVDREKVMVFLSNHILFFPVCE